LSLASLWNRLTSLFHNRGWRGVPVGDGRLTLDSAGRWALGATG